MSTHTDDIDATSERYYFGSVALVVNRVYGKVLVIATPDYSSADWDTAMMELKFWLGYVPALGKPEFMSERENVAGGQDTWIWEGDLESISDLGC